MRHHDELLLIIDHITDFAGDVDDEYRWVGYVRRGRNGLHTEHVRGPIHLAAQNPAGGILDHGVSGELLGQGRERRQPEECEPWKRPRYRAHDGCSASSVSVPMTGSSRSGAG